MLTLHSAQITVEKWEVLISS